MPAVKRLKVSSPKSESRNDLPAPAIKAMGEILPGDRSRAADFSQRFPDAFPVPSRYLCGAYPATAYHAPFPLDWAPQPQAGNCAAVDRELERVLLY